jgi:16S rRNA (guanine966-N2)-methyltransferase
MRITGGEFRGRVIKAPDGLNVRPTTDKNRQAIFNIIQKYGHPVDSHVLDIFCGTGALGLEAVSRGALSCTMVDKDKTSIAYARENTAMLGINSYVTFIQKEAARIGPRPSGVAQADLVFIDPPYRQGLIYPALAALTGAAVGKNAWLAPQAIIVIESETAAPGDELSGLPFDLLDTRPYGDTMIRILRYQAPG